MSVCCFVRHGVVAVMDCNLQRLTSAEIEVVTTIEIPYREEEKKQRKQTERNASQNRRNQTFFFGDSYMSAKRK